MAKRVFDFTVALFGLVALSPVLLVVALGVRATMGSPVLFVQERPGRGGRPFRLVKFRTMRSAPPGADATVSDAERLTPFGRWLRSTSLDELPELVNVLKGEMSLVGPRPLLAEYLPLYTPRQAKRHDVRPGITGWAQVNGRNSTSWAERLELDAWYVENASFWLDLRILLATFWTVVSRKGVSHPGHVTMERFTGTPGGGSATDRPSDGTISRE